MGYDVSYHPVDVALIHDRVLPYVLGATPENGIDDLVSAAARVRRIRWRAKAWALGARNRMHGDDAFRYIWGRPLFTTSGGPQAVADDVVRYLRMSTEDDVDALARGMAVNLEGAEAPLEPLEPGYYPGNDKDLRDEVSGGPRALRTAVAALRAGADRVPGLRTDASAGEFLGARALFDLVEFASMLTPGWMDRGHVWPSHLAAEAGLGQPPGFTAPEPLIAPLRAEFPSVKWRVYDSIVENHMVGGFVAAADVPAVREWFARNRDRVIAATGEHVALSLAKIDEALALAARLGYGFCEATEIYSGFEGRTN
jgi:hypothetical protein